MSAGRPAQSAAMRTAELSYRNVTGSVLRIASTDGWLTISVDGTEWTVTTGATNSSVGERQARAIADDLRTWCDEARDKRFTRGEDQ